jgi:Calcineurin-like phosphoesterase
MFCGDWHGDAYWMTKCIRAAANEKISTLIQVGDFGYGWTIDEDRQCGFSTYASAVACDYKVDVFWIDGNHENFDLMEENNLFPASATGPNPIMVEPRVWYIPRGTVHEFGNTSMLFLGGAYSVDKDHRTPNVSWWSQEEITDDDVAMAMESIELAEHHPWWMITHDAPEHILVPGDHAAWKHKDEDTKPNRAKLVEVMNAVQPQRLIHGHYHIRYDAEFNNTAVTGLGCNGNADSILIEEV